LYVLDVATGESTLIKQGGGSLYSPQFTPNGSSLLYSDWNVTTAARTAYPVLRIVPVTGGKSTLLFGEGHGGLADAGNGSLSPDGSLVTMAGTAIGGGEVVQFVASGDGTGLRQIPGRACSPAGTWSPDGTRIVCSDEAGGIVVVDIATENLSLVANGRAAIWLDDHTLLVEV
jgi:Tol biopolymer transport system component